MSLEVQREMARLLRKLAGHPAVNFVKPPEGRIALSIQSATLAVKHFH
ncbi:MAG: hypothetical protein O7D91_00105 [Planctomycetota bacterium]|nr:hypothetical protein [Planctomycetota bacterium]